MWRWKNKVFSAGLGVVLLTSPMYAKNFIASLMEDSVATMADAAKLLFYSFSPKNIEHHKKMEKKRMARKQELQKEMLTPEVLAYLKSKGIILSLRNKPVQAKAFAKLLVQRFSLDLSFATKLLRTDERIFEDLQEKGIFPKTMQANKTLTTKEMLSSYLKAKEVAKADQTK